MKIERGAGREVGRRGGEGEGGRRGRGTEGGELDEFGGW
jgi:hypothetical protein